VPRRSIVARLVSLPPPPPSHAGIGGITGSLLTGLFASVDQDSPINGAFFWNAQTYAAQICAVLTTVLLSVTATTVIYWVLWGLARAMGDDLRIPDEQQHDVDASQHGERAYAKEVEEFAGVKPPAQTLVAVTDVSVKAPTPSSASAPALAARDPVAPAPSA
jgi:hypothetical protein